MPNDLQFPDLNPVEMVEMNPTQVPQYLTKHYGTYRFQDQQKRWNQFAKYDQKWQTSDIIYLQFESNFDPIPVQLVDCYDIPRITLNATQKMVNKWIPGYYAYEVSMSLAGLAEGNYWLKFPLPGTTWISEPMLIKTTHPDTIRFDYKHRRFHGGVIFETGIEFGFRVEGTIGKLKPGSKDVLYEDEPLDPILLSSRPFRSFPLSVGGSKGVPDWVVDKFNNIWTCSDVTVDGKSFAKSGESKMDLREADRYPMRGIYMDVREGTNRGGKIIQPGVDTSKRLIIVSNIEGKLFGDTTNPGSSNIVPITSIE